MKTYKALLRITPKNNRILYITGIMIILIGLLLVSINTYDHYEIMGIVNNNEIILNVPTINSDAVTKGTSLKMNNKKYQYNITDISSLKVEDYINYKEIKISIGEKLQDNEVVKITFYSNKERIIKKILKQVF